MPSLNIEGRTVNVDDSFMKLSPDQQNDAVDEIATSMRTSGHLPAASGGGQQRQLSMPQYDAMGSPTGGTELVSQPTETPRGPPSQMGDIVKSIGGGLVRGAAGTVGMVTDTVPNFVNMIANKAEQISNWDSSANQDQRVADRRKNVTFPGASDAISTAGIQRGIETVTGPAHEPTTRAGRFASTAAEFVPGAMIGGPGGMVRNVATFGIAPGLASEAAGQLTEGSAAEPWARGGAALATGLGGALMQRAGSAERMVQSQVKGVTAADLDQMDALLGEAQRQGINLSRAEALQHVTNGGTKLGEMQKRVEGMGGMRDFYAERPVQNDAAARRSFDTFAPQAADPSQIGPTVGRVAQQAMSETPEAGILADTLFRAGPRATPEQAGNVMQQELRGVYDRREGMRSALADQDYTAARAAPANIDSASVVRFIDRELETAKGETRRTLEAARNNLFRTDGSLDTSVAGLHNARVALSDLIDQASRSGATRTAGQMQTTVGRLDDALEAVPAYGQARRNFSAASEPLDAFGETRVPGKIIERDQFNRRNVMPADRAPDTVMNGGPSAARDFNSVATPQAREAFEQSIVTRVLDQASQNGADLSADSIRKAQRQNEDVLRQYPGVRDRLESVAIARDGLARIESTPIGKLAAKDQTTQKAIAALFPDNPLPGSQGEISSTMAELARRNGWAARQLVRTHAESVFNEATQRLATSGPNQGGGAKFASIIRGNSQQAENLKAAVEAGIPNGEQVWQGFNRFVDILEAQQKRVSIGSGTSFNDVGINRMQSGGLANNLAEIIGSGGTKIPAKVSAAIKDWNLGRNLDGIANLLTSPDAASAFRSLVTAEPTSSKAVALVARLAYLAISDRGERKPARVVITRDRDGR